MIPRVIQPRLAAFVGSMPVIQVTGPRQSGKTTLCRSVFPDHRYVSLEPLDVRAFAVEDPRGFLSQHTPPVILDEVQRAPELFSYLQGLVDEDPAPGQYILTGSQHFGLTRGISQSLAGRVGILDLLPLSLGEVRQFPRPPQGLWSTVWAGGYPRIHDQRLDPGEWLSSYVATYVQRDVRQMLNVGDLETFVTFLRLAAGRTGQEINYSALAGDVGVSYNTIRSWLSVLEASFLIHRLAPWLKNLRKRAVKSRKLHFVDSGLACHLLGIQTAGQLVTHPLRGAIFESWVVGEVLKARSNAGLRAGLFHLREDRGTEIDLVVESGSRITAVEIKSGATLGSDFFRNLHRIRREIEVEGLEIDLRLVYGGSGAQTRSEVAVVPWDELDRAVWG